MSGSYVCNDPSACEDPVCSATEDLSKKTAEDCTNGIDDDCNCVVDDCGTTKCSEYSEYGQACSDGLGDCKVDGTYVCNDPGATDEVPHCSATADMTQQAPENPATPGSCSDTHDNDCDGFTDCADDECKYVITNETTYASTWTAPANVTGDFSVNRTTAHFYHRFTYTPTAGSTYETDLERDCATVKCELDPVVNGGRTSERYTLVEDATDVRSRGRGCKCSGLQLERECPAGGDAGFCSPLARSSIASNWTWYEERGDPACQSCVPEICDNSLDDDCDGFVDCDDADCAATDNDGDGAYATVNDPACPYDCDDSDADRNPWAEEDCEDAVDNDCDTFIDEEDWECFVGLNLSPEDYHYNVSPWMNISLFVDEGTLFSDNNDTYICDYRGCNASHECVCGADPAGCGSPGKAYFCDLPPGATSCRFRDESLNKSGSYDYTFCYANNTGADTLWTVPQHCSLNGTTHAGGPGEGDDVTGTTTTADYLHRYYWVGTGGWDEPVNCSSIVDRRTCSFLADEVLEEEIGWQTCLGQAARPGEEQLDHNDTAMCGWDQSWVPGQSVTCTPANECKFAPTWCQSYIGWRCLQDTATGLFNWTDVGYRNHSLSNSFFWAAPRNVTGWANVSHALAASPPAGWFPDGADPFISFLPKPGVVYTTNYTRIDRDCPTDPQRDKSWFRYELRDNATKQVVEVYETHTLPRECDGGLGPPLSVTVGVESDWAWKETVETFAPELTCDDGLDNDCDGLIDWDDPDCRSVISGYVFERDNATPIEGAIVKLVFPTGGNTTVTDVAGAYFLGWIPPGEWVLDVQKSGYVSNSTLIEFTPSSVHEENFTLGNGSCRECLNVEGRCEVTCEGKDQCAAYHVGVPDACQGRRPGTWADYNSTHYVLCCGEEVFKRKTSSSFTAEGCMDNLVPHTRLARYLGKPVRLIFYVWEPCE